MLAHWDHIDNRQLDYDETRSLLIEVTDLTRSQHNSVADFLWVFGYMMSLFPRFFMSSNDDFLVREQDGRNMLGMAHALQPENPIIKKLYLGSVNRVDTVEYKNACIDAYECLSSCFPGASASEEYFREILG